MNKIADIEKLIADYQAELTALEAKRDQLLSKINFLKTQRKMVAKVQNTPIVGPSSINHHSSESVKIHLFRSLFRGREDVFPKRFESLRTGKSGYQPCCKNEWVRGICKKPKVKCSQCKSRDFLPVTDDIIRNHLLGRDIQSMSKKDFTIGVYPLLPDETCWFLAADFDKKTWAEDIASFLETCEKYNVPAAFERSRSGNGGHAWIFFEEAIPASLARKLGSFLLTETMEQRPEVGLDSYDRLFPSQDTLPRGGIRQSYCPAPSKDSQI